jgi:hypothetical protein
MHPGAPLDPDLERFLEETLPAALRRMRGWRGRFDLDELRRELHQELVVDWLSHRTQLATLAPEARRRHWLRLLSRAHYRLVVRDGRTRAEAAALDELPAREPELSLLPDPMLGQFDRERLGRLLRHRHDLKNGRLNLRGSALAAGLTPGDLRRLWRRVAEQLGYGDEFLAFWRRRLVEALLGLVSDLLRDRSLVRLLDEPRRARPDPSGRLLRIRRIRKLLGVRPLPPELRRVLAHYSSPQALAEATPQLVIADAQCLAPDEPAVLLWSFEVAIVHGQMRAASWVLRRHRLLHPGDPRALLARARLLEARGRVAAAAALLARANRRAPREPRLRAALLALTR